MSEEEFRQRLGRLSRLRSLQFYNEQKAKRWKKIQFKAFRRLLERDYGEFTLEELAELDSNAVEMQMQKIEAERAKKRVTLGHQNTSP
jgi:U3 small nucleolar RNA-associated protein 14